MSVHATPVKSPPRLSAYLSIYFFGTTETLHRLPSLAHNLTTTLTTPLSHMVSTCRAAVQRLQNHAATTGAATGAGAAARASSDTMTENEKMRCTLDSLEARSPSEEFNCVDPVPMNPFVSPYYATDDVLKQLPPVKIIVRGGWLAAYVYPVELWFLFMITDVIDLQTLEMDPCLDDCVMFAKRLKAIDSDVTLDVLSGLPHGFLNFVSVRK